MHDSNKLSDKIRDRGTRLQKNLDSFETNEYIEETTPAYRQKRTRGTLSLREKIDIVRLVKFKWVPYREVAKEFRVSVVTVSALVQKVQKNPKFLRELAHQNQLRENGRRRIGDTVQELLD